MKRNYILPLAVAALLLSGCNWIGIRGNGQIVSDKRNVTEYSDIKTGGAFEIDWHPGQASLTITTDSNLLRYIDSRVDGKTLHIESHEQLSPTRRIKVAVTSPTLTGVSVSGAAKLNASDLRGPKFYLQTQGAAKVILAGTMDELLAETSGAAKLEANDLHTKNTDVTTNGAAKATVYATETLRASINGAGKIIYFGHPKVQKEVNGAGSIRAGD